MLSVVIPTFNESKNIRNLVAQIDVALKGVDYEIVFVDDSKDNTPDVIGTQKERNRLGNSCS